MLYELSERVGVICQWHSPSVRILFLLLVGSVLCQWARVLLSVCCLPGRILCALWHSMRSLSKQQGLPAVQQVCVTNCMCAAYTLWQF